MASGEMAQQLLAWFSSSPPVWVCLQSRCFLKYNQFGLLLTVPFTLYFAYRVHELKSYFKKKLIQDMTRFANFHDFFKRYD